MVDQIINSPPTVKDMDDATEANLDRLAQDIINAKQYKTYDDDDYIAEVLKNEEQEHVNHDTTGEFAMRVDRRPQSGRSYG